MKCFDKIVKNNINSVSNNINKSFVHYFECIFYLFDGLFIHSEKTVVFVPLFTQNNHLFDWLPLIRLSLRLWVID
jgi:hypothetical protein